MRVRFALNLKGGGERPTSAMYAPEALLALGNSLSDAGLCVWPLSPSFIIRCLTQAAESPAAPVGYNHLGRRGLVTLYWAYITLDYRHTGGNTFLNAPVLECSQS